MPNIKELVPIVLSLVLVGLLIGIAMIIQSTTMVEFGDTKNFNESVACVNDTGVAFSTTWIKSVTFVGNGSDNLITGSTNYSLSTSNREVISITCLDEGPCADVTCYGTGTYDIEGTYKDLTTSEASVATSSVLTATKEIATSWMGLLITVIILAIILGLVISSFGGGMMGRR